MTLFNKQAAFVSKGHEKYAMPDRSVKFKPTSAQHARKVDDGTLTVPTFAAAVNSMIGILVPFLGELPALTQPPGPSWEIQLQNQYNSTCRLPLV